MGQQERQIDIRYPELHDPDWLRRRHLEEDAEIGDLATEIGCSDELLRRALRRHTIVRPPSEDVGTFSCPELNDPGWLRQAYEDGLNGAAIADRLGCSIGEVYRALRLLGIGPRGPQRSVR